MMKRSIAFRLALFATLLALVVVMLGAYTRLKDAGLGCPDWPGCYGQIMVPQNQHALQQAQQLYPGQPVESAKAWAEMVHRYVAGTLATLIFILAILAWRNRHQAEQPILVPSLLVLMVIFQALLGKWTVTMCLLPVVVMSHLLGGFTTLALLMLLTLQLSGWFKHFSAANLQRFRLWAILGLVILIVQIFLGGWTSSNYAAIICRDFPYCQGSLFPEFDFKQAFNFFMSIGPNYQGGLLSTTARITIQMMHRYGALITFIYLIGFIASVLFTSKVKRLENLSLLLFVLLFIQICLGILNVIFQLPVFIAVAHNGVAALLLLTMVSILYHLFTSQPRIAND